ncbi:hypothetical protein OROMI_033789 [Orobanche minor]
MAQAPASTPSAAPTVAPASAPPTTAPSATSMTLPASSPASTSPYSSPLVPSTPLVGKPAGFTALPPLISIAPGVSAPPTVSPPPDLLPYWCSLRIQNLLLGLKKCNTKGRYEIRAARFIKGIVTAPILFAIEEFPELRPIIYRGFDKPGDVDFFTRPPYVVCSG